jgi:hypothetical protein
MIVSCHCDFISSFLYRRQAELQSCLVSGCVEQSIRRIWVTYCCVDGNDSLNKGLSESPAKPLHRPCNRNCVNGHKVILYRRSTNDQ